jgi:soluble lytic murein transglycosylase-like protein
MVPGMRWTGALAMVTLSAGIALGVAASATAQVSLSRGTSGALRLAPGRLSDNGAYKAATSGVYGKPVGNLQPRPLDKRAIRRARYSRYLQGGAVPTPHPSTYDPLIREISGRHRVEYALVKAVIKTESNFNPRAVSPKGARGLMQLMPATARLHNVRNMFSPRDNIEGGVKHLRMLLDYYRGNVSLALAAYNAGIGAVDRYGRRVPPYRETREYVPRVLLHRLSYSREKPVQG